MDLSRLLRKPLLVAGILPALLTLVVLGKVVVMMSHDDDGREAFSEAEFAPAAEHFAANRTWNWFEPWVAPFDQGTARHAEGGYADAIDHYEQALATVPEVEECTVRINLALAHEALGDIAAEESPPDRERARAHWRSGIDALAEGNCPEDSGRGEEQTQDAADVDARLREKLQQNQQQQQGQQQEDPPPDDQQSPQEQELEERNDEGREDRRDQEEQQQPDDEESRGGGGPAGGTGGTPPPAW